MLLLETASNVASHLRRPFEYTFSKEADQSSQPQTLELSTTEKGASLAAGVAAAAVTVIFAGPVAVAAAAVGAFYFAAGGIKMREVSAASAPQPPTGQMVQDVAREARNIPASGPPPVVS